GTDTKPFKVTVANVAPTVTVSNQSANEGTLSSFDLGSFSDPGLNDTPWSVDVDWGDGSGHSTFTTMTQGSLGLAPHTYDDNRSTPYTVTVKVTDKDGGAGTATFNVLVVNLPPTATLSNDGPKPEGTAATISFSGQHDPSN